MLQLNQIKLRPGHPQEALAKKAADMLRVSVEEIQELRILRRSIDARRRPEIFYIYSIEVSVKNEDKMLHRCKGKEGLVCRGDERHYRFPGKDSAGPAPDSGDAARGKETSSGCFGCGRPQESLGSGGTSCRPDERIVIVGTGPAGLFCGYFLALHGYRPVLLERGKCVEERQKDAEAFWETGRLDPESNVQFGEGGAGTFSDGKLNTLVKDKEGRGRAVLETFVRFGAKESILYDAKPHMGTDVLCGVVRGMREEIIRLGGQVRFGSCMKELCIEKGQVNAVVLEGGERISCCQLVLAIGHSARDTFSMLYEKGVPMESKAFAVGLRVEHPQTMMNESQYGMADPGELGAAPYKVTAKTKSGRGVYSFCVCPGGYVVNASSEEGRLAVNGMSYSARDGENANSAIVVTVMPEDFGSDHPLAGIAFQRQLEERAYKLGGGRIPVQRYGDYRRCVEGNVCGGAGKDCGGSENGCPEPEVWPEPDSEVGGASVTPQCRGAYQWADVSRILPMEYNEAIVEGMEAFGRQIRGFDRPDACLSGVESRTSSPVRILRDDSLQSQVRGLYPCGEGAGYAGGILSAAMDGIRVAEAIARKENESLFAEL